MRYALIGAICVLLLFITTCNYERTTPKYELMRISTGTIESKDTDTPTINKEDKLKEYKETMIDDIIGVWEMFFDDDNAPATDPRREMFPIYANAVADNVIYYQNNEVDIRGRMPKHRSSHILAAIWAARESSVRMDVVGPLGEVCLFQLHGQALNGFSKEEVKNNIDLCTHLGIRWIAHSTSQCENNREPTSEKWNNFDWLRPMTMYGSGPKKVYKNPIGKHQCKIFGFARRRVADISMYSSRIDIDRKQDLLSY